MGQINGRTTQLNSGAFQRLSSLKAGAKDRPLNQAEVKTLIQSLLSDKTLDPQELDLLMELAENDTLEVEGEDGQKLAVDFALPPEIKTKLKSLKAQLSPNQTLSEQTLQDLEALTQDREELSSTQGNAKAKVDLGPAPGPTPAAPASEPAGPTQQSYKGNTPQDALAFLEQVGFLEAQEGGSPTTNLKVLADENAATFTQLIQSLKAEPKKHAGLISALRLAALSHPQSVQANTFAAGMKHTDDMRETLGDLSYLLQQNPESPEATMALNRLIGQVDDKDLMMGFLRDIGVVSRELREMDTDFIDFDLDKAKHLPDDTLKLIAVNLTLNKRQAPRTEHLETARALEDLISKRKDDPKLRPTTPKDLDSKTLNDLIELARTTKDKALFMQQARQSIHGRIGYEDDQLGNMATSMWDMYNSDSLSDKANAALKVGIYLNGYISSKSPQSQEASPLVKEVGAKLADALGGGEQAQAVRSAFTKIMGKDEHLKNIEKLRDGTFGIQDIKAMSDLWAAFKDDIYVFLPERTQNFIHHVKARNPNADIGKVLATVSTQLTILNDDKAPTGKKVLAAYTLIRDMGPEALSYVRDAMPERYDNFVDRLRTKMGPEMTAFAEKMVSYFPAGNAPTLKATFDFITATNEYSRFNAVVDGMKSLTGSERLKGVMSLFNTDPKVATHLGHLFDPTSSSALKMNAMKDLSQITGKRLENLYGIFAKQGVVDRGLELEIRAATGASGAMHEAMESLSEKNKVWLQQMLDADWLPKESKEALEKLINHPSLVVDSGARNKAVLFLSELASSDEDNFKKALGMLGTLDGNTLKKAVAEDALWGRNVFLPALMERQKAYDTVLPHMSPTAQDTLRKALGALPIENTAHANTQMAQKIERILQKAQANHPETFNATLKLFESSPENLGRLFQQPSEDLAVNYFHKISGVSGVLDTQLKTMSPAAKKAVRNLLQTQNLSTQELDGLLESLNANSRTGLKKAIELLKEKPDTLKMVLTQPRYGKQYMTAVMARETSLARHIKRFGFEQLTPENQAFLKTELLSKTTAGDPAELTENLKNLYRKLTPDNANRLLNQMRTLPEPDLLDLVKNRTQLNDLAQNLTQGTQALKGLRLSDEAQEYLGEHLLKRPGYEQDLKALQAVSESTGQHMDELVAVLRDLPPDRAHQMLGDLQNHSDLLGELASQRYDIHMGLKRIEGLSENNLVRLRKQLLNQYTPGNAPLKPGQINAQSLEGILERLGSRPGDLEKTLNTLSPEHLQRFIHEPETFARWSQAIPERLSALEDSLGKVEVSDATRKAMRDTMADLLSKNPDTADDVFKAALFTMESLGQENAEVALGIMRNIPEHAHRGPKFFQDISQNVIPALAKIELAGKEPGVLKNLLKDEKTLQEALSRLGEYAQKDAVGFEKLVNMMPEIEPALLKKALVDDQVFGERFFFDTMVSRHDAAQKVISTLESKLGNALDDQAKATLKRALNQLPAGVNPADNTKALEKAVGILESIATGKNGAGESTAKALDQALKIYHDNPDTLSKILQMSPGAAEDMLVKKLGQMEGRFVTALGHLDMPNQRMLKQLLMAPNIEPSELDRALKLLEKSGADAEPAIQLLKGKPELLKTVLTKPGYGEFFSDITRRNDRLHALFETLSAPPAREVSADLQVFLREKLLLNPNLVKSKDFFSRLELLKQSVPSQHANGVLQALKDLGDDEVSRVFSNHSRGQQVLNQLSHRYAALENLGRKLSLNPDSAKLLRQELLLKPSVSDDAFAEATRLIKEAPEPEKLLLALQKQPPEAIEHALRSAHLSSSFLSRIGERQADLNQFLTRLSPPPSPETVSFLEQKLLLNRSLNPLQYDKALDVLQGAENPQQLLRALQDLPDKELTSLVQQAGSKTDLLYSMGKHSAELDEVLEKVKLTDDESKMVRQYLMRKHAEFSDDAAFGKILKELNEGDPLTLKKALRQYGNTGNMDALGTLFARTRHVGEEAAKVAAKAGEFDRVLANLGSEVTAETREGMQKLFSRMVTENPSLTPELFSKTLDELKNLGVKNYDNTLKVLSHLPPDIAQNMLHNKHALKVLAETSDTVLPFLQKSLKLGVTELAPRLATTLVKILPAYGLHASYKDMVRLRGIALDGAYTDPKTHETRTYKKEARALALLGSVTNEVDGLVAIGEMLGVGNIALPLQLGLGAGSLALDMMAEMYHDTDSKDIDPKFRGAIKALTMATALTQHPDAQKLAGELYGANTNAEMLGQMYEGLKEMGLKGSHLTNAMRLYIQKVKPRVGASILDDAIKAVAKKSKDAAVDLAKSLVSHGQAKLAQLGQWIGDSKAAEVATDLLKSGKVAVDDAVAYLGETKVIQALGDAVKSGKMAMDDLAQLLMTKSKNGAKIMGQVMLDLAQKTGRGVAYAAEELVGLAKRMGKPAYEFLTEAVFSTNNLALAEFYLKSAINTGIDIADEVLKMVDKGLAPARWVAQQMEALASSPIAQKIAKGVKGLFTKTAAQNADLIAKAATEMKLGAEAAEGLRKMLAHLDPKDADAALKALSHFGSHADDALRIINHLPAGMVTKAFKYAPDMAAKTIKLMMDAITSRLGTKVLSSSKYLARIAGKIGSGLGRALPALGVAMAAYDTGRAASIAYTGEGFDLFTMEHKTYKDPHARGIAMMLTNINALDTVLGIADFVPGVNGASVAAGIGIAVTSTVLDIAMDYIEDNPDALSEPPLRDFKSVIEVGAISSAAMTMNPILIYQAVSMFGKGADEAGKAIAQALIKGQTTPEMFEKLIKADSGGLWGDDMTRAIFKELKANGKTLQDLMKPKRDPQTGERIPAPLNGESVYLLTNNMYEGWTSSEEYGYLKQLAEVSGPQNRKRLLDRIMNQWFVSGQSEELIMSLLPDNKADLQAVLKDVDLKDLGKALDDDQGRFNTFFSRLSQQGMSTELEKYISGVSANTLQKAVASHARSHTLSTSERKAVFNKAVEAGNYELMDDMLNGVGRMGRMQDKATFNAMVDSLSRNVGNFINLWGNDPRKAGQIANWILTYGDQTQIDRVFLNVRNRQWFGNGANVIKRALDFSKGQNLEIKDKLSQRTLQAMVGTLNNGWSKAFSIFGSTGYKDNINYVRQLAQMVDTQGKALIVKDLMDGWTPGTAETLIHDVFRDTHNAKDFTQLVDAVGAYRISRELENRAELGKVMAFVIERYQTKHAYRGRDDDKVLKEMMDQWSSMSVKSDDYIYHMLKQLQRDGKLDHLKKYINNGTLDRMIDFTDDAFRDRNVWDVDPESKWSIDTLRAAKS